MKQSKEQVIKEIQSFLEGSNDELKYVVNVETNPDKETASCIIHEPGHLPKIELHKYTPFLYVRDLKAKGFQLYNGDERKIKAKEIQYGIIQKQMKTGGQPRLKKGYSIKVSTSKTYNHLINFFREGGIDPYGKIKDDKGRVVKDNRGRVKYTYRHLFYTPRLDDQFFISKGVRLFKGIEEYKDLHKLTFDIETTGLRYEISKIFAVGVRDNRGFETILEIDGKNDKEKEIRLIQDIFNTIDYIKPAAILGYNSEMFDFEFILGRAKVLNMNITALKTSLSETDKLRRRPSTVKFGNQTEEYVATTMWGYTILDILHAVKRTAAVNSELKNNKLKYICQYEGIAKENRMYIEGSFIGKMWEENKIHIINPDNNNYIQVPNEFQEVADNIIYLQEKKDILSEKEYKNYKRIFLNENRNLVEWLRVEAPKLFGESKGIIKFIKGKDILRRYLLDDLWETEQVDNLYNQSSFLLAKIVPTTFGRVATMGNAAVWNLLMTAWSYENDLAIPEPDIRESFSGGLARCYKKGYTKRLVKIDFASLYPFEQLTHDIFPLFDITGAIKKILTYMTTTRNIYKKLANGSELEKEEVQLLRSIDEETYLILVDGTGFTKEQRNLYKVKQLPIKILNNSLFGALGSAYAFNWSDNTCAARITCSGRIYLRQAIDWFKGYGCDPLLAVTDGVNFGIPDLTNIIVSDDGVEKVRGLVPNEEAWKYGGKIGIGALIEKFNDHLKECYDNESVTHDTPIYCLKNNEIDILPICDLFDDNSNFLDKTKERDFSKKDFKVLTKTGWNNIKYVFKHKTKKQIHRITTKNRLINVTEDHSLFQNDIEIKPKKLKFGDNIDVVNIPMFNNNKNITIELAWLYGFFFGDGSSVYESRKKTVNNVVKKYGKRKSWKISNTNIDFLNTCINIFEKEYNIKLNIINRSKSQKHSNNVKPLYEIVSFDDKISKGYSTMFYTKYREKKIPKEILNSSDDIKRAFIYGALDSDGYYLGLFDISSFGQKTQIGMAGFSYLLNSINVKYSISLRKDKPNFITFRFDREFNEKYKNIVSLKIKPDKIHNNYKIETKNKFVYDISTSDETFVGGIGGILCHNTSKGKENCYLSVDNDGEFDSCLNLSRINYALLTTKNKVKLTGNTIKSKTMPEFIEEFIDKSLRMILEGKGDDFVNYYNSYAEDIYYKQIPLKKIASKSKYKHKLKDYINRGVNKNGKLKASQAHMELILAEREAIARKLFNEKYDELGDTARTIDSYTLSEILELVDVWMPPEPDLDSMVYYVNTGERKSHGDVKKDPKTGEMKLNCRLINSIDMEKNPDLTGEYNIEKYLDAFNTRVKVLLDGFDEEIREEILVKIIQEKKVDEAGKKYNERKLKKNQFTKNQLVLKNHNHDDFDYSMIMEAKEVEFWNRTGYNPNVIWDGYKTSTEHQLYPEIYEFKVNWVSEQMIKAGKSGVKSVNDEINKGDYVLLKNFDIYNLGYYNGEFIEILREKMIIPKSSTEVQLERIAIEKEKQQEEELKKLRIQEQSEIIGEEKKEVDGYQQQLQNSEIKRMEGFKEFKKVLNLPLEWSIEFFMKDFPEEIKRFENFLKERNEPQDEYFDFDDGDY